MSVCSNTDIASSALGASMGDLYLVRGSLTFSSALSDQTPGSLMQPLDHVSLYARGGTQISHKFRDKV